MQRDLRDLLYSCMEGLLSTFGSRSRSNC